MKATHAQPVDWDPVKRVWESAGPAAGPALLAELTEILAGREEVGYRLLRLPDCFKNEAGHNHLLALDDRTVYLARVEDE